MDNYSLSVGVIVIRDSKVLLVKHNYGSAKGKYLNPGGYLKEGELPEEAAIREIYEETGVKMEVDRLAFVHENFFPGDTLVKKGNIVHEISFFFYMKVPEDFEPVCMSFTEDDVKEHLVWIKADHPKKYYPEFFKTELKNPSEGVKHFVTRDI